MYFEQHDIRQAKERHAQLLVEARILRLIRAANQRPPRPQQSQPLRGESLLARVFAQLRKRPSPQA